MNQVIAAFRFTLDFAEKLAADIDDGDLCTLPHPGMNHPAWILGHVALGSDLVAKLLGKDMVTDAKWMAKFGPGSTVNGDRSDYPSKEELLSTMRQTHAYAIECLESAEESALAAANSTPFFPTEFPTVGHLIVHLMTTHAAMHLGQLSAWRRCVGKGSVLGI